MVVEVGLILDIEWIYANSTQKCSAKKLKEVLPQKGL